MVDLPLLAPFLPEIGAAFAGIALIVLASLIAAKLAGEQGGGFLSYLTAPLQVIQSIVQNALTAVSNAIMASQGIRVAHLLSGIAESIQHLIFYPARLFAGVHTALVYLWKHAIPGYVKAIVNPVITDVHDLAGKLAADVSGLRDSIASALHSAEGYADHAALGAKDYADHAVRDATTALRSDFNEAIGKVQAAEDAAISHAVSLATTAEQDASAAFARAQAYADELVKPVGAELSDLEKYIQSLGLAGLIAAVPALAVLVQTIAAESGLDSAECRGKVKGICRTDPSAWLGLLESIAAAGILFNLREIVAAARELAPAAVALVREAA